MRLASLADLPDLPPPATIAAAGDAIGLAGRQVRAAADGAAEDWTALPAVLDAPGAVEPLYGALAPTQRAAASLERGSARLARAIDRFAAETAAIHRRADALRADIAGLYETAALDVLRPGIVLLDTVAHLGEDGLDRLARRNDELVARADRLQRDWAQAQQEAAAAILAIRPDDEGLPVAQSGGGGPRTEAAAVLALQSLGVAARRDRSSVLAWLAANPALARLLSGSAPDASVVHTWWTGLDDAARSALVAAAPAVVGGLEGVDYRSRASANDTVLAGRRAALRSTLATLRRELAGTTDDDRRTSLTARIADTGADLTAYDEIHAALAVPPGTAPRFLVQLDTGQHPPLAAIAVGDLDRATNVTYAVPGMGATTAGMQGWTTTANTLQMAQAKVVAGSAVVAWIGYRTPPVPSAKDPDLGVLAEDYAAPGARRFEDALAGFDAVRGDAPRLNVVAHSYGTTTTSLALRDHDQHVDAYVLIGSAGLDRSIPSAAALHAGSVYVGQATDALPVVGDGQGDQWAWTGRSGSGRLDPSEPGFGATAFGTDGRSGLGAATTAHDTGIEDAGAANGYGYLDRGSESLFNVVRATTTGEGLTAYHPEDYRHLSLADPEGLKREALREAAVDGGAGATHVLDELEQQRDAVERLLDERRDDLLLQERQALDAAIDAVRTLR